MLNHNIPQQLVDSNLTLALALVVLGTDNADSWHMNSVLLMDWLDCKTDAKDADGIDLMPHNFMWFIAGYLRCSKHYAGQHYIKAILLLQGK